jgi:hypothetical protein
MIFLCVLRENIIISPSCNDFKPISKRMTYPWATEITGCFLPFAELYSKESGLRGPGFARLRRGRPGFDFTPEGWNLPLDVEWNDGMVE